MYTTTQKIIENFVSGSTKGKASSLYIVGDKLYNYNTVIAQRVDNHFILNVSKYSQTTSKHQNRLKRLIPASRLKQVDGLNFGVTDLSNLV